MTLKLASVAPTDERACEPVEILTSSSRTRLRMNIIEPGIRNLATAKDVLLTPYGLDESLLTRTLAEIFTHQGRLRGPLFPGHPQRRRGAWKRAS